MYAKYSPPFFKNEFYHVYNRGNNGQAIFFTEENYKYFLRKFYQYLSPYLDVYAFCLLLNHFHFLVRVRSELNLPDFQNLAGLRPHPHPDRNPISQAFSNFFNAYSKAINKQENRSGSLFEKPFKRIWIHDNAYLTRVIYYIHRNPVHHKICKSLEEYRWSSYHRILDGRASKLKKKEVLDCFGGRDKFIEFHREELKVYQEIQEYLTEG